MARAMLANMRESLPGRAEVVAAAGRGRAQTTAGRPSSRLRGPFWSGLSDRTRTARGQRRTRPGPACGRRRVRPYIAPILEGLPMRSFSLTVIGALAALGGTALAQTTPAPAPGQRPGGAGATRRRSRRAAIRSWRRSTARRSTPATCATRCRRCPPSTATCRRSMLFPMLLDQLIDRKALVLLAREAGAGQGPAGRSGRWRARPTARCRTRC